MSKIPPELLAAIKLVTAKRARTVIDHILEHGYITTEDLKSKYGYNHPPRAARDVREEGIPLETFPVEGSDGRTIAAYRFGDPSKIERHKLGGRQVFSKKLKQALFLGQGGRCGICCQPYEIRYLQVDHRIPYEVAGDQAASASQENAFLLICASCQRSKSWSCEHCANWQKHKRIEICRVCYWASPEAYEHIAGNPDRRVVIFWTGKELKDFEALQRRAQSENVSVAELLKRIAARRAYSRLN